MDILFLGKEVKSIMSILNSIANIFRSHSKSTGWAIQSEITRMGFDDDKKQSGVVLGINPYTRKLMLDDSNHHVLLAAPTRSGKGVNTILPTSLLWKDSLFCFDYKGELYAETSGYRSQVLGQKIIKFSPSCDGGTSHWNSLSEIRLRTKEEWPDAFRIAQILVAGKDANSSKIWTTKTASLIAAVMLHLLYKRNLEGKRMPNLHDVQQFFKAEDFETQLEAMTSFPHITEDEFFEQEDIDPEYRFSVPSDEHPISQNPFCAAYGEYIRDFQPFQQDLGGTGNVHSISDLREAMSTRRQMISFQNEPWCVLLTHPKVRETCLSVYLETSKEARATILTYARMALDVFGNATIYKNLEVSDFSIRDLLDASKNISLYFTYSVQERALQSPVAHLFVSMLLDAVSLSDAADSHSKHPHLLVLLDDSDMLGYLDNLQPALVVCGTKGTRILVSAHNLDELAKTYGDANRISSNCGIQLYFTPNSTGSMTGDAIAAKLDGKVTLRGNALTSKDIMNMSSKRGILFVDDNNPILIHKFRYYKYASFTKKTNLPQPDAD